MYYIQLDYITLYQIELAYVQVYGIYSPYSELYLIISNHKQFAIVHLFIPFLWVRQSFIRCVGEGQMPEARQLNGISTVNSNINHTSSNTTEQHH